MKKIFIILFLFLSLAGNATKYYLAPTTATPAGNDANAGTIGAPFFTINKAWTFITSGDTVYMRGGTYSYVSRQSLTGKNGTATDTIKVWNYPGETPVITKAGSYTEGSWPVGLIYFVGDYVYWKGLEVSGFTQATTAIWTGFVAWDGTDHCKFERLKIHNNGHGMVIHGASDNNLILNCDFYKNNDPLSGTPHEDADGLEINIDAGTEITVRGCRMWWNSDDGIDLWASDGDVTIDSCWTFYNGYLPGTFNSNGGGDGNGFKLGNTDSDHGSTILRQVTNGITYRNKGHGVTQNGALCGSQLYNNTSYLNRLSGYYFYGMTTVNVFTNNIAYQNDPISSGNAQSTYTTNTFLAYPNNNSNFTFTNADFVNITDTAQLTAARQANGTLPVNGMTFLHLQGTPSSDLINRGTYVGIDTVGAGADLGAFEFGNFAPWVAAPMVSTQLVTSIDHYTATGNGVVIDDGGSTVTDRGVCWSTSTDPTKTGSAWSSAGSGGMDSFSSAITGLQANTLYYVRAWATNGTVAYGANVTFTTSKPPLFRDVNGKLIRNTGGILIRNQ